MAVVVKIVKTKAEEQFSEHFLKALDVLPGNDNIVEKRRAAFARFETLGLPHRRVEEWKFTDLKSRMIDAFGPAHKKGPSGLSEAALGLKLGPLAAIDAVRIVFVDGFYDASLSTDVGGAPLSVSSIAEALQDGEDYIVNNLGAVNPPEKDEAIVELNTAFMRDGAFVRIEGALAKPLQVVFVTAKGEAQSVSTRNVISVAAGASATILETYLSLENAPVQNNCVTEMMVADGAHVHHIKVQQENVETTHLSTSMARLGKDVVYRAFQFTTGAGLSRNQMFVRFAGEGTKLNISGAFLLRGKQHGDLTLVVDHAVPHCESREMFKTVLDDEARGVFQGKVIVRPHAQKTDGEQMSRALLLSETAEFDSKPELEIYADDVVCGHGATSGQVDEELLFYLMARGIQEEQARALLISAFIGEALEEVEDDNVRDSLGQLAEQWLHENKG